MLVDFCIYLAPSVLMASIFRTLDLWPLNAVSNLLFVRGDDLAPPPPGGALGDISGGIVRLGYIPPKEKNRIILGQIL